MGNLNRRAIFCPEASQHQRKKILLLLSDFELNVFCKEHGWLRIHLFKDGDQMNFNGVVAKVEETERKTNFVLEPIPTIGVGDFKSRRKPVYA